MCFVWSEFRCACVWAVCVCVRVSVVPYLAPTFVSNTFFGTTESYTPAVRMQWAIVSHAFAWINEVVAIHAPEICGSIRKTQHPAADLYQCALILAIAVLQWNRFSSKDLGNAMVVSFHVFAPLQAWRIEYSYMWGTPTGSSSASLFFFFFCEYGIITPVETLVSLFTRYDRKFCRQHVTVKIPVVCDQNASRYLTATVHRLILHI